MPPRAAQFLVEKIVSEASIAGVPLSDNERKMLLFSEISPTLPDMVEVNEVFDRDYDRAEYESKISKLICHLRKREHKLNEANRRWNEAVESLRGSDYYLLVMIDQASPRERRWVDLIRLVITALLIVGVFVTIVWFATAR